MNIKEQQAAQWGATYPVNILLVHCQETLMLSCLLKKCVADSTVSRGADAGYSIADRVTDRG